MAEYSFLCEPPFYKQVGDCIMFFLFSWTIDEEHFVARKTGADTVT